MEIHGRSTRTGHEGHHESDLGMSLLGGFSLKVELSVGPVRVARSELTQKRVVGGVVKTENGAGLMDTRFQTEFQLSSSVRNLKKRNAKGPTGENGLIR